MRVPTVQLVQAEAEDEGEEEEEVNVSIILVAKISPMKKEDKKARLEGRGHRLVHRECEENTNAQE